jgi:precorrin-2/cobalt-factor-2 C20-methyltransferase
MEIIFPMRAHKDYREYLQSGTLDALYGKLEQGKNVAMVTLGDVSIYSTAAYVRQLVESKGFETEVVAGVTSFCAGAARAKVSLCENGQSLCVLPGVQDQKEILQVLNSFDTVVILKAGKILKWLLPVLEEYHLLENTVMLRNVGREDEYIGAPVLEEYSYFTTLLIRKGNG